MPRMRKEQLENIKKAVRTRPDWNTLMKDLEGGVKLKHVAQRNDRSTPVLPGSRGKNGKFVYDSEKPMVVNELLHDIQRGVQLRRAHTNDRSKVDFNKLGLKKFRRQMTMEEKRKLKPEDPEALPSSSDDEEDIDCMRDDLDSTRVQLADELKKSKKLGIENKVLKIDVEALDAEVKKLKRLLKDAGIQDKPLVNGEEQVMPKLEKSMSRLRMHDSREQDTGALDNLEGEIKQLTGQIDAQRQKAEKFEIKVNELEQKLIVSESNSEEWEGRAIFFEKKYKQLQKDHNIELPEMSMASTQMEEGDFEYFAEEPIEDVAPISRSCSFKKSASRRSFSSNMIRMDSFVEEDSMDSSSSSSDESFDVQILHEEDEESSEPESGGESGSDEEIDYEKIARMAEKESVRIERDLSLWNNKFNHIITKEQNHRIERKNLRDRVKKFFKDMYNERVEYLKTKTELDELIKGLKEPTESDEEEPEEEEEEEEEEVHPAEEEGWWFDKPDLGPRKLKKKKKKIVINEHGEEQEEEDLEDLTQLEEPYYSDTEEEGSDQEDEDDLPAVKLNFLQSRTKRHEEKMLAVKKGNYLLKTEVDQCKDRLLKEKLRRRRLDEELNMLLSDMQ